MLLNFFHRSIMYCFLNISSTFASTIFLSSSDSAFFANSARFGSSKSILSNIFGLNQVSPIPLTKYQTDAMLVLSNPPLVSTYMFRFSSLVGIFFFLLRFTGGLAPSCVDGCDSSGSVLVCNFVDIFGCILR